MNKMTKALLKNGISGEIVAVPKAWELNDDDSINLIDDVPTTITVSNAGVPAELLTNFSNKVIEVLHTVTGMVAFAGEAVLIGTWGMTTDKYRQEELVGHIAPYSDYSEAGLSDANNVWIKNDFYLYQTVVQYGELENEINSLAKINRIEQKQRSAATQIARAANRFQLYGVAGLNIYGLLTNPFISSALTPDPDSDSNSDLYLQNAIDMYKNLNRIILEIINNSGGHVDATSSFKLASSPKMVSAIMSNRSNPLAIASESVLDMLKRSYPKLDTVMIPECETAAGTEIYVKVEEVNGQKTCENVTNCQLRVGKIVQGLSSQKQKYFAGTAGLRVYYPFAIAHMLNPDSES
mgnify:CR=1 FL=1